MAWANRHWAPKETIRENSPRFPPPHPTASALPWWKCEVHFLGSCKLTGFLSPMEFHHHQSLSRYPTASSSTPCLVWLIRTCPRPWPGGLIGRSIVLVHWVCRFYPSVSRNQSVSASIAGTANRCSSLSSMNFFKLFFFKKPAPFFPVLVSYLCCNRLPQFSDLKHHCIILQFGRLEMQTSGCLLYSFRGL